MAEQFSLCWDNFHSNMSSSFSALLKNEDLVDVTLAAEGRYLKAHKIVLSVCSPYFQELFQVNPCQHPIVFLKDVSYSALSNLLQFMYQGEVKVSQDELTSFIKVAEALKIKGLTGDGVKENDDKDIPLQNDMNDTIPKDNSSRKASYGRTSPARKKMMGPASKRFRSSDQVEPPQHLIEDVRTVPQEPEEIMQFKMEPEEMTTSYQEQDDELNYDDTNPDASNMSDSADYLLEAPGDNEMREAKAGTSTNTDPTTDNQGNLTFIVNQRGQTALIFEDNIFHVNRRYEGTTFWQCMEYRKHKCRCRCITTKGSVRRSKTTHNHPPNTQKIKQKCLNMKCVKSDEYN